MHPLKGADVLAHNSRPQPRPSIPYDPCSQVSGVLGLGSVGLRLVEIDRATEHANKIVHKLIDGRWDRVEVDAPTERIGQPVHKVRDVDLLADVASSLDHDLRLGLLEVEVRLKDSRGTDSHCGQVLALDNVGIEVALCLAKDCEDGHSLRSNLVHELSLETASADEGIFLRVFHKVRGAALAVRMTEVRMLNVDGMPALQDVRLEEAVLAGVADILNRWRHVGSVYWCC